MEYKGYVAKIEYDPESKVLHGRVLNIRDVINFQGTSIEELEEEFKESVEVYLEFCKEKDRKPDRPFSGRFVVRVEPSLHRDIATCASRENLSINRWVNEKLQSSVNQVLNPQPVVGYALPQGLEARSLESSFERTMQLNFGDVIVRPTPWEGLAETVEWEWNQPSTVIISTPIRGEEDVRKIS